MFEDMEPDPSIGWGMKNSLDAVLFAEDLLDYVFTKLGYKWTCTDSVRNLPPGSASKRFVPAFGEAVIEVMSWNIESIANSYRDLLNSGVKDTESYKRELCISATMHFWEGYSPETYLTFCSLLAGISVFYFASGKIRMVEVSAEMLAFVINFYIYHYSVRPYSDWFGLYVSSQVVRRTLLNEGIHFVSPPV